MPAYLFTIPQRYRRERHPLGVGADDLIRVEAASETEARIVMNTMLGPDAWCSAMAEGDPETDRLIAEYYPGRTVDLKASGS